MEELRQQMALAHAAQEQQAALPRLQLELAAVRGNYAKTVCLLRALKAGQVRLDQVVIDGDNWQVLDPAQVVVEEPKEAPEG